MHPPCNTVYSTGTSSEQNGPQALASIAWAHAEARTHPSIGHASPIDASAMLCCSARPEALDRCAVGNLCYKRRHGISASNPDWPGLTPEQRRQLKDTLACHSLRRTCNTSLVTHTSSTKTHNPSPGSQDLSPCVCTPSCRRPLHPSCSYVAEDHDAARA